VNKFIANGTFHKIKTRHFTNCTLKNVRGKGDPRNVMAVVTERVHNGYKLGTSGGILLGSYTRNQFKLSNSQFLDKETVDKTSEISLRNAVYCYNQCLGGIDCCTTLQPFYTHIV
jgi:hypothetical protein